MVKRKKRVKKKRLSMPKLPANEAFWLSMTKSSESMKDFVERGNPLQRKSIKAAIDYRLWQIQEGKLPKDYFGDFEVKKLDYNIPKVVRKPRKKKEIYNGDPITPLEKKTHKKIVKEVNKVIDLFDMGNIEDLVGK